MKLWVTESQAPFSFLFYITLYLRTSSTSMQRWQRNRYRDIFWLCGHELKSHRNVAFQPRHWESHPHIEQWNLQPRGRHRGLPCNIFPLPLQHDERRLPNVCVRWLRRQYQQLQDYGGVQREMRTTWQGIQMKDIFQIIIIT